MHDLADCLARDIVKPLLRAGQNFFDVILSGRANLYTGMPDV